MRPLRKARLFEETESKYKGSFGGKSVKARAVEYIDFVPSPILSVLSQIRDYEESRFLAKLSAP